jgi:outer membrane protein assembly factor BamB
LHDDDREALMGTADGLGAGARGRARWMLMAVTATLAALVLAKAVAPVLAEAIDPNEAAITGVVFEDRDGNGARDEGEDGVSGVSVSDGVTVVETGADGGYSIDVDIARRTTDVVFITKPAGWALPTDEFKTPRFYRSLGEVQDGQTAQADFAMLRDPEGLDDEFTFANVADPHVNGDLAGQMRQINATSQDLAFIQVSGDLTNNATDAEFTTYKQGTAASQLPVWPAVGNHEYRPGATYAARIDNYRRHVGPEWYSFDHGNRHFLVIENNGAAPFDEQLAWMEQDLAAHAEGKRVVVLMHQPMNVPFGSPSQYDAYQALLEQYETELVLVGHEHSNDVDKTWVRGAKHIQTNSSSYTIDHSPRGFRFVAMRGKSFTNPFRMYGVERDLTIVSPQPGGEISHRERAEVQVNAYYTSDVVEQVRYRVDGDGPWHKLHPSGDFTWYGQLERGDGNGREHSIEVEAVDEGGVRWSESAEFAATQSQAPTPEAGADWPQFHGDAAHSGIAADVLGRDLQLAWSHRGRGAILTGSPAIVDGVAYVGARDENGDGDGGVRAVDLETGRQLWEFETPSSVHGSPAVAGGMVYVPTLRGTLFALDARDGKPRWKREPEPGDPPFNQRSYSYYSPALAEGKVYWAYQTRYGKASRGLLTALDPKTGAAIWESPMTGATMSDGTPAVADGRVYVGNETADRVIAYDADTGAQLWTGTNVLGGWQDAAPTAVGGRVFIGSNNRVVARDATTGANLWTYQSPDASWIPQNATPSAPAVVGDTLYMGFPDGRVTALNVATGAVVWSVRLPGKPYLGGVLSAPAVTGDTIYIGSNDGYLYGLDRTTGAQVWSYEIGTWVASAPAVSGDTLVTGAWDGNLYAFTERE